MDKDRTTVVAWLILNSYLIQSYCFNPMDLLLDFGTNSYPPGSEIDVTIVDIEKDRCFVKDDRGCEYTHWYNTCPLWPSNKQYAVVGAMVRGVVGKSTTTGREGNLSLMRFFVRSFISLPQSQQEEVPFDATDDVPRSPYDVITAKGMETTPLTKAEQQLDATLESINRHAPKPKRKRSPMGNVTYTPELTARLWHAADKLGLKLGQVSELCIVEGRTPEALIASRGV